MSQRNRFPPEHQVVTHRTGWPLLREKRMIKPVVDDLVWWNFWHNRQLLNDQ